MKNLKLFLFLLFLTAVFTACSGEQEPTATPEPATAVPTDTPEPPTAVPTDTPEPPTAIPTNTPAPPTATPEPTATPDPTANFTDFTDNDLGITLQYPDDWTTFSELGDDDAPILLFTSNEAFVDGPDDGESGALLAIVALPTNSAQLTAVLAEAIDDYALMGDDETPVGEATAVTIDQQNALQQITTGESNFDGEYTTSYTVVYIHNRNFLIITFAPTEELASYDPVLNAMTDSLQFAAPVTASTVTNDNFTTYTYGNQIAFRYPQTWVIEEDIGNDIEIVVSTSQELLDAAPEDARGAAVQISVKSAEEYDYLPGDSLVNTLDAIIADIIDADSEIDVVHATSETIINGLPAAATAFNMAQEGIEGYLTFALIPYGDSILLAWGVAIGGVEVEYIPVFDQVFATITVPDAFATYQSDSDPITFNYPSHWIIDELEDGLVLQSDAELITDESFPTGALQFLFWREFDELLTPVEYAQIFVAEFNLIESQEAVLEPSALTINGQDAATATYTGEFFGSPVVVRYTTFIQGEQAVASIAITAVSDTPTYVLPQDLTANSIRILGTAPQQVDFTNPTAVVQALFDAAAAADFTILPTLCDPLDENDGDTADICAITEEHELRDPFIEFFANGMILGEPEIDGNFAEVNFSFGPNNSETETMTLILRDGFWYLYSF